MKIIFNNNKYMLIMMINTIIKDNSIIKEKDDIIKKKDDIIKEKMIVLKKRDDIIKGRDAIIKEKNVIINNLNLNCNMYDDAIINQRDIIIKQRDIIINQTDNIIKQKNIINDHDILINNLNLKCDRYDDTMKITNIMDQKIIELQAYEINKLQNKLQNIEDYKNILQNNNNIIIDIKLFGEIERCKTELLIFNYIIYSNLDYVIYYYNYPANMINHITNINLSIFNDNKQIYYELQTENNNIVISNSIYIELLKNQIETFNNQIPNIAIMNNIIHIIKQTIL